MSLILFCLALPVVTSMGYDAPSGEEIPVTFSDVALWDWSGLLIKGLAMFSIGAIATIVGFRLSVGAVIFAVVFTVSTLPFESTLNWLGGTYGISASVVGTSLANPGIIWLGMWFVFLFAFIQLASVPVEHD